MAAADGFIVLSEDLPSCIATGFQVELWSAKPSIHFLASEQPERPIQQERVVIMRVSI